MANFSSEYTFRAVDQITPFIRKIKAQMDGLKQQMRGMSQRIKLNVDSRQAQTNIKRLSQQFYQFARKPKILGVDTRAAHTQIQQLSAHYANSMRAAQAHMLPAAMKQKPLAQAVPSAAKAAAGGAAGGSMGMKSLLAGFGGYMAVGSALDLGKAETELKKFTGATGPELEALKKQAFDLESATGYSAASIMGMMSEASKAGVATNNLASDVLFAAKAGIAFDMSATDAAAAIIHLRSSFFSGEDYATQQEGLGKLASMISYVADNSASSEPYLVNFLQRSAAVAQVMGASKESLTALGATFEAIGIPAEVAARAMNNAQIRLVELASDAKTLKTLGLDPAKFRVDVQKDLVGSMMDVIAASSKLDKLEQTELLIGVFGQGFADELVRAGSAQKIYTDNLTLANDKTKQAAAFNEAYQIQMEGLNASWNRAKEGLKTVLGIAITPYLKAASDAIGNLMEFAKKHPTLIKFAVAIIAITTATKAYSMVSGIASGALKAFILQVGKSSLAMSMATHTSWMWGGSMRSLAPVMGILNSPMARMALGIGILTGAFMLAYDNSQFFKDQLSGLGDQLMEIVKAFGYTGSSAEAFILIGALIGEVFGGAVLVLRTLIAAIMGNVAAMKQFFTAGDFTSIDGLTEKFAAVRKEVTLTGDEINKMWTDAARSQRESALKVGDRLAEVRRAKEQADQMGKGAEAVQNTKAAAGVATGIPTTASPQSVEQAKAAVAQQKAAADTSKAAADTNKLAADTSKAGADSFKSGVDRFGAMVGRMESSINNLSNIKINVGVAGASGGLNLGGQGR